MFEWLLDYQELTQKIEYLEYKLDREKNELKRWTSGDLFKVRLTEGSIASGLEERIEVMEYELAHAMNDEFNAKKLIGTFKGLENQILFGKYVEGKTLVDVADDLDMSPNYIYNKHAQLVRMIDYASNLKLT